MVGVIFIYFSLIAVVDDTQPRETFCRINFWQDILNISAIAKHEQMKFNTTEKSHKKTGDKLNVSNDFQGCSIIFKFRNNSEQINSEERVPALKNVPFKRWQNYFCFETISNQVIKISIKIALSVKNLFDMLTHHQQRCFVCSYINNKLGISFGGFKVITSCSNYSILVFSGPKMQQTSLIGVPN